MKSLAIAVLLSAVLAPAVYAADGPNDACMKSAYGLAEKAEEKKLSDATLEKLDGMFNTMEKHCKALELGEAQATAAQIQKIIDAGK